MMKKVLTAVISVALLAGCSSTANKKPEVKKLKVGIGSVSNLKPKELKDNQGSVQFSTTIATVALEGDVIKYLNFDVAQNTSTFDGTGKFTSNHTETPTKKEKKDGYGMKKASKIGKEWYEQAESLEKWAIGKKVSDFKNMKAKKDDHGTKVAETDLQTGVTVRVDDFLASFDKAVNAAVEVEGVTQVASASSTKMENKDAKSTRSNVTYAALALDKDNKIVLALTDVAQNTVKITNKGAFDGEVKSEQTKLEKKDAYGMKKASKIGKEWYEQNAALDKWFVGKTKADVEGMKTEVKNNHVVSTDKDLLSGATIGVDEFQKAIVKAFANVKEVK
ncbi:MULTISPECIES: hypothetical protein [Terrabacteria group]|uniref:hypothetical protein n=1 Tax=Bacillati TaxID=1783272 RepID=UPI001C6DF87D|nr:MULTISPECIES: hypothetical protein [Terrabacteria group]MBW9212944.1 hypothetical protein [Trueperella sp. zg.1013]